MLSGKPTNAVLSNTLLNFIPFYFIYLFFRMFFYLFQLTSSNSDHSTDVLNLQDLIDPMMVMFEEPDEEEEGVQEDKSFEVTEAIPDVELFEYKTSTRTIHVVSGA